MLQQPPTHTAEHRLISIIPTLLSDSFDTDELNAIRRTYRSGQPLFAQLQMSTGMPPPNRYETLFRWPLPSQLMRTSSDPKTVGDLLALFTASPIEFEYCTPDVFDILEFAAAFLSSRTTDRASPNWREEAAKAWFERSVPAGPSAKK